MSYGKISMILCWSLSFYYMVTTQRIEYLSDFFENDGCLADGGIFGVCRKLSDCKSEFENFKMNLKVLKVCEYSRILTNNVICCPENVNSFGKFENSSDELESQDNFESSKSVDYLNFNECQNETIKYQSKIINTNHLGEAMNDGFVPINEKNCEFLNRIYKEYAHEKVNRFMCRRTILKNYVLEKMPNPRKLLFQNVENQPSTAAIGWTQYDDIIDYNCYGSIITERFIITAANCEKSIDGLQPDVVRVGDRYLATKKDDENVRKLRIQDFIVHPNYTVYLDYNDIALLKTTEKINFNKFVMPACIDDFSLNTTSFDLTVSGFSESDEDFPLSVSMELNVELVSNEECNKIYEKDRKLTHGIIDSQFCVKSNVRQELLPDMCFGDTGGPLQVKNSIEIKHDDFNSTYLSSVYRISTIMGVASFGRSCGLAIPSVYTKISYFKSWINSVINT